MAKTAAERYDEALSIAMYQAAEDDIRLPRRTLAKRQREAVIAAIETAFADGRKDMLQELVLERLLRGAVDA